MQGSITQIAALVLYGNYLLQNATKRLTPAFLSNSAFQFCESVSFVDITPAPAGQPGEETQCAANPMDWFEHLRNEGVCGLCMRYGPSSGKTGLADRMLVGFVGGGGRWLIEAYRADEASYWESRWQLGDRNRPDRNIWRVSYLRIFRGKAMPAASAENLEQLKQELRQCLEEIVGFSRSQKLDNFTKCFEAGLAKLDSSTPLAGLYLEDIAPPGFLSLRAMQLLGAAEEAWVFGGMGSWNDMGFAGETQMQYEKVSERLYQLLNRVIVAVVNSRSVL